MILPVGSNEQHGPSNPLGTDHLIAKSIAEETARAVDETSSGVYGKQSTSSAEKGRKVFEAVVNERVKHVNLLKKSMMED